VACFDKKPINPGAPFEASIVWIRSKRTAEGQIVKEVIYERHDEPDLLRELEVPEGALYSGAVRGDTVIVEPSLPAITKAKASA
jgi:hypothetical protein